MDLLFLALIAALGAITIALASGGVVDQAWFGLAAWFGFFALRTPA